MLFPSKTVPVPPSEEPYSLSTSSITTEAIRCLILISDFLLFPKSENGFGYFIQGYCALLVVGDCEVDVFL
jgi:hypothetical protein